MQTNGNINADKERLESFLAKCRERGLKITPQRIAVYETLLANRSHPSAETVFSLVRKIYPNISLDTVNRTLHTLESIGEVFAVEGSGSAKRYDIGQEDHQHFRCLRCNRVIDVFDMPFEEVDLPEALKNCKVLRATVYYEGICQECE